MPSNNQDRGKLPSGLPLYSGDNISLISLFSVHLQEPDKLLVLCRQEQEDALQQIEASASCSATFAGNDPANPMVIEVSMTGKIFKRFTGAFRTVTDKLTVFLLSRKPHQFKTGQSMLENCKLKPH